MALFLAFGGFLVAANGTEPSISSVDIAQLVKQFAAARQASTEKRVVALVSLGMPSESLRRMAKNARSAGIPLILRGLKDNSVQQTIEALRELKVHPLATWQVDPSIFRALKIRAVPAVVVISDKEHLIVRGDVPLEYSLSLLAKKKNPLASTAAKALSQLKRETVAAQ